MQDNYAQALWKVIAQGADPKKSVRSLAELLKARGRDALLPRVARSFARIAQRNASRNDVVLTVAREKGARAAGKRLESELVKLGVDPKDLKTQVDDCVIGGWRLEGKETLIDNSYKKHLLSVYNRLVEK